MEDVSQMANQPPDDECMSKWNHPKPRPSPVRRLAKVWAVLFAAGLVAIMAVACGDGEEPGAQEPPPPSGEEATLAPCRALQSLQTYRYSVSLKLESPEPEESSAEAQPTPTSTLTREFRGPFLFEYGIEASFVAPDRTEAFITAPGSPFSMIVIGNQTWVEMGGQWTTSSQPAGVPYRPPDICEAILADLDLSQGQPEEEKLNDVEALHYTFSQVPSEQAMSKIFGAESDMGILLKKLDADLWLAEKDNRPVRIDVSSSGLYADGRELRVHLLIDVTDANSEDIRVEPPL